MNFWLGLVVCWLLATVGHGRGHSWMCTIFVAPEWRFLCYCTVLNNRWVITSADCFKGFDSPDIHRVFIRYPNGPWEDRSNQVGIRKRITTRDRTLTVLQTAEPLAGVTENTLIAAGEIFRENDVTIATYESYGSNGTRQQDVQVIDTRKAENAECNPVIFEDETHFCMEYCNAGRGNGVVTTRNGQTFLLGVVLYEERECEHRFYGEDVVAKVEPYKTLIEAEMKRLAIN
uniref:Salivary serine protease n=1 Tax=Simulium nigrimanum TaxID=683695 RepID=D1FPW3_SIMNI